MLILMNQIMIQKLVEVVHIRLGSAQHLRVGSDVQDAWTGAEQLGDAANVLFLKFGPLTPLDYLKEVPKDLFRDLEDVVSVLREVFD